MRTAETCVAEATGFVTQGKFQEAIKCFKQAVGLDPHHITAFLDLGNTYIKVNQFDLAIESFKKAIEINPDISNVYRSLGNAYRFNKQYEEALSNYQHALKLNDKISEIYDDIGLLHIAKDKNHAKAVQSFQEAIKIDGFSLHALNNASRSYIQLGDHQKANLYNEKALLISPKCHQALQIKEKLEQI